MRPLRYFILLLVLASALLAALVRPLPGVADTAAVVKKQTRKQTQKHVVRRQHHHVASRRPLGVRVANYAKRFRGVPYVWGGASPRPGFDCSGLVRYVYQHFGVSLPHSSYADMTRGRAIPRKYLKPGDLVFFAGGSHVGIFVGRNRLIDAPYSGAVVHVTTMTSWYSSAYDGARRVARVALP